jgi:uridine kinase
MTRTIVVGIAGGSASGKSTITTALAEALRAHHQVTAVSADRYMLRDRPDAPMFFSPSMGKEMFDANHPNSIVWEKLNHDLDTLLQQDDRPEILLMEGHLLFTNPELRERLDLRIFVELDADERALRRLIRDLTNGRSNGDPVFIANYYRECARVGHARYIEPSRVYADLIIRGDAVAERIIPMLAAVIVDRQRQASTPSQAPAVS